MITAKRLAELMTPEMLTALADYMEKWRGRLEPREAESGMHDHMLRAEEDALDEAAAVLREVAGRGEKPAMCCGSKCVAVQMAARSGPFRSDGYFCLVCQEMHETGAPCPRSKEGGKTK